MSWSEGGAEARSGGVFTKWFTKAESHGPIQPERRSAAALPHPGQVPCMACKFDEVSAQRHIMCLGGKEHVPDISLFGERWFAQ